MDTATRLASGTNLDGREEMCAALAEEIGQCLLLTARGGECGGEAGGGSVGNSRCAAGKNACREKNAHACSVPQCQHAMCSNYSVVAHGN